MIHTPLSHMTTDELIQQVLTADDPSWLEIELMQRIESLEEEIESLEEEIESLEEEIEDLRGNEAARYANDVHGVPV